MTFVSKARVMPSPRWAKLKIATKKSLKYYLLERKPELKECSKGAFIYKLHTYTIFKCKKNPFLKDSLIPKTTLNLFLYDDGWNLLFT